MTVSKISAPTVAAPDKYMLATCGCRSRKRTYSLPRLSRFERELPPASGYDGGDMDRDGGGSSSAEKNALAKLVVNKNLVEDKDLSRSESLRGTSLISLLLPHSWQHERSDQYCS